MIRMSVYNEIYILYKYMVKLVPKKKRIKWTKPNFFLILCFHCISLYIADTSPQLFLFITDKVRLVYNNAVSQLQWSTFYTNQCITTDTLRSDQTQKG